MTPILLASAANAAGLGAGGAMLCAILFALFAGALGAAIHAPPNQLQQTPSDVRIALTEYKLQYVEALDKYKLPEAVELGEMHMSNMLEERYPIAVGDPVFESLVDDNPSLLEYGEVFFEMFTAPYSAGVKAKASTLRTSEWQRRAWGNTPGKHAYALRSLYERLLAGALMNGETATSCENRGTATTIKIFQKGHPCNPLVTGGNTYDNLLTGASAGDGSGNGSANYPGAAPLSVDGIRFARNMFRTQLGPNGVDPRGYDLTHIMCGVDLEETLLTAVKDDLLLVTSGSSTAQVLRPNPLKKYRPIVPIINPLLTEAGVWYAISADETGQLPWMTITKLPNNTGRVPGMPGPAIVMADGIEWIILDENSDSYKIGSKVAPKGYVAIIPQVEAGSAVTWPWRIKRCKAS